MLRGACMVDITKKYRTIRHGSESLKLKSFAWQDQAAISFYRTYIVHAYFLFGLFIQNCSLRIMIVYNFGEINTFYCRSFPEKQYLAKRHVDIVSTIPVPSTICSQSLVTLFTKEFTALFKVRNICMELFVFYQKFITE